MSPPSQLEANKLLNTLSVDNFPIPGDATFPLNAHYAPPGNRADAGKQRYYASVYIRIPNTPFRVLATIPYTGPTGTCLKIGRATICRWFRKAKQVVDVVPEEAFHEQEFGIMKGRAADCGTLMLTYIQQ